MTAVAGTDSVRALRWYEGHLPRVGAARSYLLSTGTRLPGQNRPYLLLCAFVPLCLCAFVVGPVPQALSVLYPPPPGVDLRQLRELRDLHPFLDPVRLVDGAGPDHHALAGQSG